MPWAEFDGKYSVSDKGRVYSHVKDRLMVPQRHTGGYAKVCLTVDSKWYNRYIHRMVAELFLSDWDRELQVNHVDGNKWNNSVSNLEMVTPSQNILHAHRNGIGGAHHLHKGGTNNFAKPVAQYSVDGEFIAEYRSTFKAQCATGVSSGNLSAVARGKRKTAGGFIWKWTDELSAA